MVGLTELFQIPQWAMFCILILLIDTVASKMSKSVMHGVLLCAEVHKTVIKEIHFERIEACYECVDSDIILEAIDEMRISHVMASNLRFWYKLALGNMCIVLNQLNSSTTFCVV